MHIVRAKELHERFVNCSVGDLMEHLKNENTDVRVVRQDGVNQFEMDQLSSARCNIVVENGIVIEVISTSWGDLTQDWWAFNGLA